MSDQAQEQLEQAVARNIAAVLSLPSAGMLRHHKSRFLGIAENSFWMEMLPEDQSLIDELIKTQKPAGVSYKSGPMKTVFASVLLERTDAYPINNDTKVCAVRLQTPAVIKQMQRRQNYRVRVPKDFELSVEIARISPKAHLQDRPVAGQRVQAELMDISVGGMGVVFIGNNGEAPRVCEQDRLRISLSGPGVELVVEGAMRFPLPTNDKTRVRCGISFTLLESDLAGRQTLATLTRIIGELQRAEARRVRLGVA